MLVWISDTLMLARTKIMDICMKFFKTRAIAIVSRIEFNFGKLVRPSVAISRFNYLKTLLITGPSELELPRTARLEAPSRL